MGRLNEKVLPFPLPSLSIQIGPPWASTKCLAIVNPIPSFSTKHGELQNRFEMPQHSCVGIKVWGLDSSLSRLCPTTPTRIA